MVTALYRRYRPEAFAEMIGQSQVTEPLMTALRTGRIGHAYLFSGPRGCGKTTSARILARCLNCAEGPTDTPCGTCPSCVELSRDGGGSLDVVEIDAASHGGVDDARDLRERAVFAPARDRFKIFIIDEAHMVTPGGFNALLKIVEEPPPHVKFVFATTEPDKVIGTIRSRTHHYPFRLIAPATLIDYVQTLCDSEGVDVEAGVLPLVVRAGGGSVRDTLSILDQLIAGSESDRVTKERAAGLLGFTHSELLDDVVAALGAKDSAAAFRATDRVVQTGQDPRRFVEDLLERLRDLIVVGATNVQGASAVFRGVPEDQLQRMFEQTRVFRAGELSAIADTVSAALDHMAGATAPRLQLELMIARALVQLGGASAGDEAAAGGVAATGAGAAGAGAAGSGGSLSARSQQPGQAAVAEASPAAGRAAAQQSGRAEPSDTVTQTAPTAQNAPVAPAAGADPDAAASALNAAEAARAAREFLRTDSAGAASFGRPVTDVLGMMQEPPADAPRSSQSPQPEGQQPSASPSEAPASPAEPSAPTPQPEPAASAPTTQAPSTPPPGPQAPPAQDAAASFEELVSMWPDLLEEILESDRDAWNAVHSVRPLALDGDVLTLGFASESDLTVFKASGAGPLRETLLAAFGVRVRYVPKALPAQSGQAVPPSQGQGAPREPGGDRQSGPAASEPAEEPRPEGSSEGAESRPEPEEPSTPPSAEEDPLLQAAAARVAALQSRVSAPQQRAEGTRPSDTARAPEPRATSERPRTTAPAPNAEISAPRVPEPDDYPPHYADGPLADEDPYGGQAADPYLNDRRPEPAPASRDDEGVAPPAVTPGAAPAVTPSAAADTAADTAAHTDDGALRDGAPPAAKKSAPSFTRYGEAVVREVLGARFIEERPLPEAREG